MWYFVHIQVTSFIREESRKNMQIIVISLKEEFFSKADALLGVYSDVRNISNMLEVSSLHENAVTTLFVPCCHSLLSACSAAC